MKYNNLLIQIGGLFLLSLIALNNYAIGAKQCHKMASECIASKKCFDLNPGSAVKTCIENCANTPCKQCTDQVKQCGNKCWDKSTGIEVKSCLKDCGTTHKCLHELIAPASTNDESKSTTTPASSSVPAAGP